MAAWFYSTCTLNAVEDDAVVDRLFADYPEAEVLPMDLLEPTSSGRAQGVRFGLTHPYQKAFCIAIGKNPGTGAEKCPPL